jgi:hypothetical protein
VVWRALAVLEPYCAVCDVSYVVEGGRMRAGTEFRCATGRPGAEAFADAPRGRITEWRPPALVATRLELPTETWTTRIELAEADAGTRVTMTVTLEPSERSRVLRWVQRSAARRLVERTVAEELDKVPAHVEQAAARD